MVKWPNGKKIAVMLTFDVDAETMWISRNPISWKSPETLSRGAYAMNEAVPRTLDLLDKHNIKSSFFIPGWVIEKFPQRCKEIHEAGHEFGYHGYLHEFSPDITYEQENALMEQCEAIIEDITGYRPVGHRSPMGEFLPHTVQLLVDRGYKYATAMKDWDVPYFHKLNGEEVNLVEIPTEWMLEDSPYYMFTLQEPVRRGISPGSHVFEIWTSEFDGLYDEGKIMNLTFHPQMSGRVSRIKTLDEVITYMKRREGTWFARCDEVAQYLIDNKDALKG